MSLGTTVLGSLVPEEQACEMKGAEKGVFGCDLCGMILAKRSEFITHRNGHGEKSQPITDESHQRTRKVVHPPAWKGFDEALVTAMNELSTTEMQRFKALHNADKLGQFPVGISIDGTEQNAVVPRDVYDGLPA